MKEKGKESNEGRESCAPRNFSKVCMCVNQSINRFIQQQKTERHLTSRDKMLYSARTVSMCMYTHTTLHNTHPHYIHT